MTQTSEVRGRSTTIFTDERGMTNVIYHKTAVVAFNANEIILKTNGWQTMTTKVRMNQTSNQFRLGFRVHQKNGEWFVEHAGMTKEFIDGMILQRVS